MKMQHEWPILAFILFVILVISGGSYQYYKLTNDYNRLLIDSSDQIKTLKSDLAKINKDKNDLSSSLDLEKQRNDQMEADVKSVSSTVSQLDKLSKTDRELLKKYSRVSFLNENYIPASLATITPKFLFNQNKTQKILTNTWPYLEKMIKDASDVGVVLRVASAYRSFAEQATLKSRYLVTYGQGANKFSADQGYSEHQLGTTIDLIDDGASDLSINFAKTKGGKWLADNAYKYGFVLSYPDNNSFYQYEPWHWRFVGVKLATYLHDNNKAFYTFPQRLIDQYLISIFD